MFNNRSNSSRLVVSTVSFLSVFTAGLLQVQNAYALHVTRAMAGADGIWEATQNYAEPLYVTENGVTIDLQGHRVETDNDWAILFYYADDCGVISTGSDAYVESSTHTGILALDSDNLEIDNIETIGEAFGLTMQSCDDAEIRHLHAYGRNYDGVWIENGKRNELYDVTAFSCGRHGIVMYGGSDNVLDDCHGNHNVNGYGITLLNSPDFLLTDCEAWSNIHGLLFNDSDGEVIECLAAMNTNYGFVDDGRKSYILNEDRGNVSGRNGIDWSWDWHSN
jgi:parallel beta-helix repeat protein